MFLRRRTRTSLKLCGLKWVPFLLALNACSGFGGNSLLVDTDPATLVEPRAEAGTLSGLDWTFASFREGETFCLRLDVGIPEQDPVLQSLAHSVTCTGLAKGDQPLRVMNQTELPRKNFSFVYGYAFVTDARVEATFRTAGVRNVDAAGGAFVFVFPTEWELESMRLFSGRSAVGGCSVDSSTSPC